MKIENDCNSLVKYFELYTVVNFILTICCEIYEPP